jgi:heme exporter protein C
MTVISPMPPKLPTASPITIAAARTSALRCWAAALAVSAAVLAGLVFATSFAPASITRMYYIHVPAALTSLLACAVVFFFSLAYLWTRGPRWDHLALASARVAFLLCSLLLITGILWANRAWGVWWDWSPRLTFSLILWVLYGGYLVMRTSLGRSERVRSIAAIYGIIAFLDVPLVYLCVKLLPDIHPETVQVRAEARGLLLAWMGGLVLLSTALTGFIAAWVVRGTTGRM